MANMSIMDYSFYFLLGTSKCENQNLPFKMSGILETVNNWLLF